MSAEPTPAPVAAEQPQQQPPSTTPIPPSAEAGPSTLRVSVIDKWLKPNGPPKGVSFGARKLGDEDDVWSNNAWDHAELPDDFNERAAEIMEKHRSTPVPEAKVEDYNARPAAFWDAFYSNHADQFFKNRRWLPLEFPELVSCCEPDAGPKVVLEVGCGAGNTVFPLLMNNENPDLRIFATDYSATAVKVVQSSELYPRAEHGLGVLNASVWDISAKPAEGSGVSYSLPEGIEPGTVDVLTVIYVLSALHPKEWEQAIHNLYTALKPGGLLCIRDYGRHDLAQLRIKQPRLLDVPNFYIRGDGTRVYFFETEELGGMLTAPARGQSEGNMFNVHQLAEDRRLIVNRKEQLKMYRIWLQAKATKIE
ncbi:putative methyltransferase-like protein [Vanrija pseudolonga]|uniref:tRNA N(3)-methylcytidine methyltransferase n=1 Tax=Vanrija pseudolonga TaxID=143232 RepID=A0AAF0YFI7_9TREE|nr:purtative methyltransferase-like protein [Vanrija pseudolonga]